MQDNSQNNMENQNSNQADNQNSTEVENIKTAKKGIIKKAAVIISSLLVLLIVGVVIYGYSLLNLIDHVPIDQGDLTTPAPTAPAEEPDPTPSNKPDNSDKDQGQEPVLPEEPSSFKDSGIINILLLGTDNRSSDESGRSDAMMIATLDTRNNQIKLSSLMRDMYVTIPGKEDNRINTGYIFGGPSLAIKTVNHNFNMNIEHYVSIDFQGFKEVIDLLGGVEVTVTDKEAKIIGLESAGTYNLNGSQALSYARIRKIGGDYERTERQRTVLKALFEKSKSISLLKIPGLLAKVLPHIETSLSKTDILYLGGKVLMARANPIQELRIPLDGTFVDRRIRNMAVLVPDLKKNTKALHEFIYGKSSNENSYADNVSEDDSLPVSNVD